jgi:hypothetical protein
LIGARCYCRARGGAGAIYRGCVAIHSGPAT